MIVTLFANAFRMMAVYVFGATGDIIIEKSGHLNMGVPGIMFFGALGGIVGEISYANNVPMETPLNPFLIIFIPILMASLFGAIGGLLYSLLTVTLKCNQNVVGLAMTTFGVGVSRYFISTFAGSIGRVTEASSMIRNLFPGYQAAGAFGEIFLSGSFFTYFAILLAIGVAIILKVTKVGLNLRAVGENPASADAAGINVTKYKYLATIIGSIIVAIGGLTFEMDVNKGIFLASDPVDGYGWLCLSIVILCAWRSWISIPVGFAIGFLSIITNTMELSNVLAQFLNAIPYIATVIVLIISSAIGSKKMQPPAGLGKTYFREDR